MSTLPAARVGDDIAHSEAGLGMALGIGLGILAGVAIVAATVASGGAALAVVAAVGGACMATSAGGLGGMFIGEASMGPPCGKFVTGSLNVKINGKPATFTFGSTASCSQDSGAPQPLATGSSTVSINIGLAGRRDEKVACSAKSIAEVSPNVFIGGESASDPRVKITPEVPEWAVTGLEILGAVGLVLTLPYSIAEIGVAATAGGLVLGDLGGKLGTAGGKQLGEALGLPESGIRTLEVVGGLVGSLLGGAGGAKGVKMFNDRYQITVEPNTLGMNGGNIRITPRAPKSVDPVEGVTGGSTYGDRMAQTPVSNGSWSGARGESTFVSDHPDVKPITGDKGVTYNNARPDFKPYAKDSVEISDMGTSRSKNFSQADKAYAEKTGQTQADVAKWRKDNNYTWHEREDLKTMDLVPSAVNGKYGHLGGVGEIKAGATKTP